MSPLIEALPPWQFVVLLVVYYVTAALALLFVRMRSGLPHLWGSDLLSFLFFTDLALATPGASFSVAVPAGQSLFIDPLFRSYTFRLLGVLTALTMALSIYIQISEQARLSNRSAGTTFVARAWRRATGWVASREYVLAWAVRSGLSAMHAALFLGFNGLEGH